MRSQRRDILSLAALCVAIVALVIALRDGAFAQRSEHGAIPNAAAPSQAGIPTTFSYQGLLRDGDGNLVTGSRDIVLSVYGAASGGTVLFSQSYPGAAVRDGMFNLVLGDGGAPLPSDLFTAHPSLFIGVKVGTDPELIPRQRIHAQPWAFRAANADVASLASQIAPGITASGMTLQGPTALTGDVTVGGMKPIIIKRYVDIPMLGAVDFDTEVSALTHSCSFGGYSWVFDIDEGNQWGRYENWLYVKNNSWWITAQRPMQNNHPPDTQGKFEITCFRNELAFVLEQDVKVVPLPTAAPGLDVDGVSGR